MREFARGDDRYRVTQRDAELVVVTVVDGHSKERVRRFVDAAKADIAMKRGIEAKLAEGFVEISRTPLEALPPHERAVVDDPRDDEAWLVLGDWLAAEGDPRAELIALSVAGRDLKRQRAILNENIAALVKNRPNSVYPKKALENNSLKIDFQRGFIREARIYAKTSTSVGALVRAVLALPSARFMYSLRVTCAGANHRRMIYDRAYTLASVFAEHPPLAMRALVYDISTGMPLQDMASFIHHCPNLEYVYLAGVLPDFDGLRHDALTQLTLKVGSLGSKGESDLANAKLPRLTAFTLKHPRRAEVDTSAVARFLSRHAPRVLRFSGTQVLSELVSVALHSTHLERVTDLAFTNGALKDADVALFEANASRLSRLKSLDLSGTTLSRDALDRLRAIAPSLVAKQTWSEEEPQADDYFLFEPAVE